jgi:hypothetical protein
MRKANLDRLLRSRADGIFVNQFEAGAIGPELFRAACRPLFPFRERNPREENSASRMIIKRYTGHPRQRTGPPRCSLRADRSTFIQFIGTLGGLIVDDGQCELFNRIDVAVSDDGDERKALIEEILGGPQGVSAAVFGYFDDARSFARLTLHNEHDANSALR